MTGTELTTERLREILAAANRAAIMSQRFRVLPYEDGEPNDAAVAHIAACRPVDVIALVTEVLQRRSEGEAIERGLIAGWNACRKDIYRLCEDMQEESFSDGGVLRGLGPTPRQEAHSAAFNAGWKHAAKSIARAFAAYEAVDADRIKEARSALALPTQESE